MNPIKQILNNLEELKQLSKCSQKDINELEELAKEEAYEEVKKKIKQKFPDKDYSKQLNNNTIYLD